MINQIGTQDVLSAQHKDWLNHPVTIHMLKVLKRQKEHHMDNTSIKAFIGTDQELRNFAISLNTLNSVNRWVTNTAEFVTLLDINK